MNYEQMNNNRLKLTGIVVQEPAFSHEVFGEAFYETALSVARLSQQKDVIPITVSGRLLTQYEIAVGDTISIDGQFRSYNKLEGDKSRLLLTAFVRDIIEGVNVPKVSNQIDITGYICKPPVYRTTPFKREICDVLLAVNRAYNKSDYIPCILWGRNARYVQYLTVGEKLSLSGRIQSRVYTKTVGTEMQERVAYEVSVNRLLEEGESFDNETNGDEYYKLG